MVVIGLSGSGKSTLLRCINRLIDPTEGQILWNGIDLTTLEGEELRKARRQIGMVFQQFNLVKRSNVLTNVMAGRLGYAPTWSSVMDRFSKEDQLLAKQAMERMGITELASKRADELSGGQQQRVGIARALMQDPKIILADEPVASLDPVLAHSILSHLERLNKDDHITVLCSLHYLDLVQRYGSHVIGLRAGRLVYEGSREDIRRMTDEEFKRIYGEDAERLGGLTGSVTRFESRGGIMTELQKVPEKPFHSLISPTVAGILQQCCPVWDKWWLAISVKVCSFGQLCQRCRAVGLACNARWPSANRFVCHDRPCFQIAASSGYFGDCYRGRLCLRHNRRHQDCQNLQRRQRLGVGADTIIALHAWLADRRNQTRQFLLRRA